MSSSSKDTHLSGTEGGTVTLSCSYETSSTGYVYLFWYRQFPNQAPQYILQRGAKQARDETLGLADTAVYYCLYKNPPFPTAPYVTDPEGPRSLLDVISTYYVAACDRTEPSLSPPQFRISQETQLNCGNLSHSSIHPDSPLRILGRRRVALSTMGKVLLSHGAFCSPGVMRVATSN
uniref:Ig-like domain-containing protein n=1 Tax=Pelusios castaneus TaxID=367368 RepID=A0A8C8VHV4_9SAUR